MFTEAQQRTLVEIARDAVRAGVAGREPDVPRAADYPAASGAFVTL
jgi:AMMECR1 domain-containing protein